MKKLENVLEGNIKKHMLRLALPSVGGMLAIIIFNLTDTFFVSKLGTDALAAMGFTFPIILVVGSFSAGISMGASSIIARATGSGNNHKVQRIATDGILLSVLAVIIIAILGLLSMDKLFTALGASETVLPLVKQYMFIWYSSVIVFVLPSVSDTCMRGIGDMIRPLFVMLTCAIINLILDPILIFGYFGLPAMGIQGAAVATVIGRFFGMILSLYFAHTRYHLINFKYNSISELFISWREILHIGIPGAIIILLPQLIKALLTKLAATSLGAIGVAALATATRIESFSVVISMAVGAAIIPIIGQNYGANLQNRVKETRVLITSISIIYGIILFVLAIGFAKYATRVFSTDEQVIYFANTYLVIIFIGAIGLNLYTWLSEAFNAVGKPKYALYLNLFGTCLILVPAILVGYKLGDYVGMLIGLSLGQLVLGLISQRVSVKALTH